MAKSPTSRAKISELISEARNRSTSPGRLRELAQYEVTHRALARNQATPVDLLRHLVEMGTEAVLRAVATSRHAPDDLLIELASSSDYRVARALAMRSKLPDRACLLLANSEHYRVQWAVALRKQLPVAAIEVLARSPETKIQRRLVSHANTPSAMLREFAADPDPTWALDVLQHPNVDTSTVESLAAHSDPAVRDAAAEVMTLRTGVAAETAHDDSAGQEKPSQEKPSQEKPNQARSRQTKSSKAAKAYSQASLHKMLGSPDHRDRALAVSKVKSLTAAEWKTCTTDTCWLARRALGRRRDAQPDTLRFLASDPVHDVRSIVAQHRATPADTLQELALTQHAAIAGRIAANANTSSATLVLLTERFPMVRRSVARHANVPPDLLWSMIDDKAPRSLRSAVARSANVDARICDFLAVDPDVVVRRTLAANHAATTESLALLRSDTDQGVRAKLAANPNTPPDMLRELAVDPDPKVYQALAHNRSATAVDRVLAALQ